MRCDEAQMLIDEGYWISGYSANATLYEEVASHLDVCLACRENTISIIWRNFRRRPGPFALLHARNLCRDLKRRPLLQVDAGPIQRVLSTFLKHALQEGVYEVVIEVSDRNDTQYPQFAPLTARPAEEPRSSPAEPGKIMLNTNDMDNAIDIEVENVLRILFRKTGVWQEYWRGPFYIHYALVARAKSRAFLTVSQTDRSQEGALPFQYEGSDYNIQVKSEPQPLGERIHLTIARVERIAA